MSHIHIEGDEPPFDRRAFRRMTRTSLVAVGLVLLLALGFSIVTPYTEWLWYRYDARQPSVYLTAYATRGWLFLGSLLLLWPLMHLSFSLAFRQSAVYLDRPDSLGRVIAANVIRVVQTRGPGIVRFAAPVLAFFFATGFSNEWLTFLMARNSVPFGQTDPLFGRDLAFFVFELPWYRAIANSVFAALLVTTLATVGVYVAMQAMAALAKIELGRPQVRRHLSILVGLTILALAAQMGLKLFEFGLLDGAQFTGAGYTANLQLTLTKIFVGLLAVLGLGTIAVGVAGGTYRFLGFAAGAAGAYFLIALLIIPTVVQRAIVEPDKINRESRFAERAIKMTRFAYGLDRIEVKDVTVRERPTAAEVTNADFTLENMRLWDPDVYRQAIQGLQALKPYYEFHDVDIDRYQIGDQRRMVLMSPRDIRIEGLSNEARTWVSERLVYTHGYGVVMSPVNEANSQGQPNFLARDIPTRLTAGLNLEQPRLYFSDFRDAVGSRSDPYVYVNTRVPEFDYPAEGDEPRTYRWTSERGIPVGGLLARLAFSLRFADGNLLISGNITGNSRLLMRRNIVERASRIYPFLRFDGDPYLVVREGRLLWILDAYTVTDRIPYSARIGFDNNRLNYIRNSVKVTLDAYSGESNAYAIDADDPVLKVFRRIYPGLVLDADRIPAGLNAHWRYPDDLFLIQSSVLTQYHVTAPQAFLDNRDAWAIPNQRGPNGERSNVRPYYVMMRLPEGDEGFKLILPFTPNRRENMSGWLAAHCDPDRYGQLTLYRYTRGSTVYGPSQIEAFFSQDEEIANINRQFNNEQSEIVVGNLLVMPIGQSVMYAESLFLQSRTAGISPIPELRKVVLALKDRVVVADTYPEALQKLFGEGFVPDAGPAPAPGAQPTPAPTPTPGVMTLSEYRRRVGEAAALLNRADQALRQGDFARFGELQKQARQRLDQLSKE